MWFAKISLDRLFLLRFVSDFKQKSSLRKILAAQPQEPSQDTSP